MSPTVKRGYLAACICALLWGTTFISIKVLLEGFSPMEILLLRFTLSYLALLVLCPRRLKTAGARQELILAGAGLSGVSVYYLLENLALTMSLASNVSIIVSLSPCFTAILVWLFGGRRPTARFLCGFVVAMAGVVLISVNGSRLQLNPAGDLLAVAAALGWGFYSVCTQRAAAWGYPVLLTTRRIFFYGLLFLLPALPFLGFSPAPALLLQPRFLLNFLFLGIAAGALGFVTWNHAIALLGPVRTSVFIYLIPVITIAASALILHEPVTPLAVLGAALVLSGLALSQTKKS